MRKEVAEKCCGLMWNFDKIQLQIKNPIPVSCCGLMWNFDKIQPSGRVTTLVPVVV